MSPPHLFLEHPIHVCYEFYHLRVGDDPVTVDVKDSEYFDEDLLRCPVRHDVIHDHELGEVHLSTAVSIKHLCQATRDNEPRPDIKINKYP